MVGLLHTLGVGLNLNKFFYDAALLRLFSIRADFFSQPIFSQLATTQKMLINHCYLKNLVAYLNS